MANLIYPQNEILQTFAQNGNKATLPETNADAGRASLNTGFPPETQKPLSHGGLAPNRQDFNGALNLIYQWTRLFQSGGSPRYTATLNYLPHCIVVHNNILWWCLRANGPQSGNGVFAPGSNAAYWQLFIEQLEVQKGEPEKVGGGAFNRKLVITSTQNWRVPYTGSYKITCIGGGGGGGAGGDTSVWCSGAGGNGGGTTSVTLASSTIISAIGGGGGGGGGVYYAGSGGGGGAGVVYENYFQLTAGNLLGCLIGGGGAGGTASVAGGYGSNGTGTGFGYGSNPAQGGGGGNGGGNGSNGSSSFAYKSTGGNGTGGSGGVNATNYGGGGGGGGGRFNWGSYFYPVFPGSGSNGGRYGSADTATGGAGGSGAVIIEYYDESIG